MAAESVFVRSVESTRRRPGLDVLRGVAIGLVLLRHGFPSVFGTAGIVGVVVFFTLSGYLITGLLTSELARRGRVDYGRFYRNRVLRLMPALLALLVVFTVVEAVANRLHDRSYLWKSMTAGATYTTDLHLIPVSPGLSHLWTLAVEEQFYLLWPFLLVVAIGRRRVGALLLTAGVGSWLVAAAAVVHYSSSVGRLYNEPQSWAVTLIIGSAASVYRQRGLGSWSARRRGQVAVASAVALGLACLLPEAKQNPATYLVLAPLVALATVALISVASTWQSLAPGLRPLRMLGTVSYAAYMWDYPIVCWLRGNGNGAVSPLTGAASIVLALAAATASWWLIERPVRHWRMRLDARAERSAPLPGGPDHGRAAAAA